MARVLLANVSAMPARERNATRWLLLDETARVHHPRVGDLEFEVEALRSHDDEDQTLFVYLPKPGSRTEEALADLSNWQDTPERLIWPSRV